MPTVGILPFKKVQAEVGVDYFANTAHPWLFNARIGTPENSFFKGQPTLALGIMNAGGKFSSGRADADVAYLVVGKTIPKLGRVSAGPYIGNHAVLVNGKGEPHNYGYMVAVDHGFLPTKEEYNRLVFAADYASGKNVVGAAGAGLYYFFTKDISLLVGPTFFNDQTINGKWKMSVQLDVNLPQLFGKKK
jgi:hypothetical protein